MTSRLNSAQSDWVEAKVKEGFESSRDVNSVLLGKSGVPAMPEQDHVIRLAQAELAGKREAVDFMMRAEQGERPVFSYQTKLVVPSDRKVEIAKALLDGQPKTMGTSSQSQQPAWMYGPVERHLASRPSRVVSPTWYWELGQGDQIIETPQRGDDPSLALTDRDREWLRSLPAGMRGTDLSTWSTRMAAGIRAGKPLDIRFPNDATNTTSHEQWNYTILDEEREFTEGQYRRYLPGAFFDPDVRNAYLGNYCVDDQRAQARWRAAVDGSTRS